MRPSARTKRGDRVRVLLLGRQVIHRDVSALARERDRDRRPHPGVRARDERLAPNEPPRAAIRGLAVVRARRQLRVEPRKGLPLRVRNDVRVPLHRVVEGELIG